MLQAKEKERRRLFSCIYEYHCCELYCRHFIHGVPQMSDHDRGGKFHSRVSNPLEVKLKYCSDERYVAITHLILIHESTCWGKYTDSVVFSMKILAFEASLSIDICFIQYSMICSTLPPNFAQLFHLPFVFRSLQIYHDCNCEEDFSRKNVYPEE